MRRDQAANAKPDVKARIERRIAAISADRGRRAAKLEGIVASIADGR
ncbi:MAG: hypothetical protein ICV73_30120 [Acetobacteraceae bacterium]|nr:hypothetical protein [Acetobacteraceae bacterium]